MFTVVIQFKWKEGWLCDYYHFLLIHNYSVHSSEVFETFGLECRLSINGLCGNILK